MATEKGKIDFSGWGVDFKNIPYYTSDYFKKDGRINVGVAGTADMVRQFLKAKYPGYKFWVRSSSYSGGDSIHVYGWNLPDDTAKEIDRLLNNRFQEGSFNGMEDIYEYGEMEKVVTPDGKSVDYGTKYLFYRNEPPYDSKEKDLPVPDYSKIKDVPRRTPPMPNKKPFKRFEKKDNTIKDTFIKKAQLSTGWDLYFNHSEGTDENELVLIFDYSVGKAVYDKEKWSSLKEQMQKRGLIWSLRLKGFFLSQDRGGVQSLKVSGDFAMNNMLSEGAPNYFTVLDDIFIEHGYKPVRENKRFYDADIAEEKNTKKEPVPAPVPAPSNKGNLDSLLKGLETLNKYSPSDELTKKIKALQTLKKYA